MNLIHFDDAERRTLPAVAIGAPDVEDTPETRERVGRPENGHVTRPAAIGALAARASGVAAG